MFVSLTRPAKESLNAEKWYLFFFGCVSALFALMPFFQPLRIPCLFKTLTRLPCPTCGATRTLLFLRQGDFSGAFHLSPLLAGAAVAVLMTAVYALTVTLFNLPRLRIRFPNKQNFRLAVIAIIFLFTINWFRSLWIHL